MRTNLHKFKALRDKELIPFGSVIVATLLLSACGGGGTSSGGGWNSE